MINSKYNIILLSAAAIVLSGCSEDETSDTASLLDAVELTRVNASIESGTNSRSVVYLEDRISRYQFVAHDRMTFTKIERTANQINRFQYRDVAFENNASGAWERDKNTGYNLETPTLHPERIYWSDATSTHTFVGYSLPQLNSDFDWKKSAYYYDKDGNQQAFDTYYGAIGNPLDASELIDYNPAEPATETIVTTVGTEDKPVTFGYSQKLRDEDLLLTYDDMLTADNSVANIKFYHALSSVRVIVNISGFYGSESDAHSTVSNMILHNQPTLYRWKQQSASVDALLTSNEQETLKQATLWGTTNCPAWNQRKNMKLWNTNPEGEGTGASKTFTFYGITVPQDADYFSSFTGDAYKTLDMSFDVTYPDPMNPANKKIKKQYRASIDNPVKFYPGKCTTIHISLNHRDETMTVGASYQDWEYIPVPDEGTLKKKETFLDSAPTLANRDKAGVTIAGDQKATADDATWLYEKKDNVGTSLGIFDIYGNDGSATSPYVISTAKQLLSFAYEVQNGRTFEHQYVKLDADITLQETSSLPTDDSGNIIYGDLVQWIGIGDATHTFEGFLLGNNRHINNLYGKPFFSKIGVNAVVDKVDFANVVKVNGSGVIADVNSGLVCACNITGDVEQSSSATNYCGSFVGDNKSFIVGCTHTGEVSGYGYVGGLVGINEGAMVASYHVGLVKYAGGSDPNPENKTDGWNLGGSTGFKGDNSLVFSCYFNGDLVKHTPDHTPGKVAWARTTAQMQSGSFVNRSSNTANLYKNILTGEMVTIENGDLSDQFKLFENTLSLNDALDVYLRWLDSKPTTGEVPTNCRTFTGEQIQFLKAHYSSAHNYRYTPGAYPKIQ